MRTLQHLFPPIEFNSAPPSNATDIGSAEQMIGRSFPKEFKQFLLTANGGEGFVGDNYLVLWPVEDIVAFNRAYEAAEYIPGLQLFGSNGGGEGFAFDDDGGVVCVPFIGMAADTAIKVGATFNDFLNNLQRGSLLDTSVSLTEPQHVKDAAA